MSSTRYIALALEAPMQSWGTSNSAYGYHNTNRFPTRSAILMGILANMGIQRNQTNDILHDMCDIRMTTIIYSYGSIVSDYQNCRTSYDEKGKMRIEKGKPKNIQQFKDYIVGGRFGVILEIRNDDLIDKIHNGFSNPVYPFYAGRANCPFSFHPYVGTYDNRNDALCAINGIFAEFDNDIERHDGNSIPLKLIIEPETVNPIEDIKICDVPLGMYNKHYRYDFRYVREIVVDDFH